ncbi:MAG: DUF1178 family protein [Sphingomonas sp.]|uniref:DUF1178 family protein n=1 Tax=Sphingomonas sp. TaxID=28214 RepID=UPI0025D0C562|nr:DUF1178 family protein [Sphingomonas sp.]MBY0283854.1 DUF1178 family protein [Sphingomonas sp.]
MIVFDLRCGQDHVFEAWFGSSAAYEDQRTRGLVCCPICNDSDVTKAVMAPNVGAKGNRALAAPTPSAPDAKSVLAKLAELQAAIIDKSEWVGRSFPDRARAMYLGEETAAPIHGETTAAEARELIDEGVPIAPLLIPFAPPSARN